MPLYALTIFASALLLFLLQLITAKQILPWFGGSSSVWITCLVFFQCVLLLGYAYSDWSIRRLTPQRQAIVHAVLLTLSLALLPVIPDASWKPGGAEDPAWRILALLAVTIGLPYFLLSTTNPLIQAWFARTYPGRSPYRLFALSNFASMLALLGYPLAIEPWFTTTLQAQTWSAAYIAFVALCGATAWHGLRAVSAIPAGAPAPQRLQDEAAEPPPTPATLLLWVALAAMASFLLLAVTNHLTQDVASIPLLWVLPLSIYLLTFILCFDRRLWYRRDLFLGLLALFLCAMAWTLADQRLAYLLLLQIGLFSAGLFVACMFCHGELNRLRPAPRHLTRFYLMVALGGALGALLVGIVAPLVLPGLYELGIGLTLLAGLVLYQVRGRKLVILWIGIGVLLFTSGGTIYKITHFTQDTLLTTRDFYGVLRVKEQHDPANQERYRRGLFHGTILHGDQYPAGRWRRTPPTYLSPTSGVGLTLQALQQPNARVGILGLGVGALAAYGRPGDVYRFYEINPAVIEIANREFTYLKDSAANIEIVPGDARLSLEREPNQRFDVLTVGAFSGAAIPLHLLTYEALAVYLKHLQPRGVIAFQVANKFFDFVPVVLRLADAHGLKAAYILEQTVDGEPVSDWVLLTRDQAFLDRPEIWDATFSPFRPWPEDRRPWTDDFNNLLRVLK